jgi:peroxiredoxin family protein
MNKLFAAAAASVFVFVSMSTFAADAIKKDELTVGQRADMRARADQMKIQRNMTPVQQPVKENVEKKANKAKHSAVRQGKKANNTAKRELRKARGNA